MFDNGPFNNLYFPFALLAEMAQQVTIGCERRINIDYPALEGIELEG
jgi:hypothetical protein